MHTPINGDHQTTSHAGRTSQDIVVNAKPRITSRSLKVFVDLGLSNAQIAKYHAVPETKVISLRRYYGLK